MKWQDWEILGGRRRYCRHALVVGIGKKDEFCEQQ